MVCMTDWNVKMLVLMVLCAVGAHSAAVCMSAHSMAPPCCHNVKQCFTACLHSDPMIDLFQKTQVWP